MIQVQCGDGCASHCGQPVNFNADKSKILRPTLLHRMEKARLLSRAGINRDHLASFPEVATRAGEREVQQRRGTAFALWDDMFDVKRGSL